MNEIIKNARIQKGYTQENVARILDMPLRSYQSIEYNHHEPKVIIALKLCQLLDVDPFKAFLPGDQRD